MRFADVVLDADRMLLERAGSEVAVEPQVFEVLSYLVAHRDRMVPKTELLDEIWGDRFVSESALTSRIKSARQAIGDNGRDQRLIRTVHGRGFRFVGEVVDEGIDDGEADRTRLDWTADGLGAAVVAEVRNGRGVFVELVGPSGRARTDALEEVVHAAAAADLLVGRGGAGELRSLASVLGAFDEWAQRRPEVLDLLPEGCAIELRAVLDGAEPTSRQRLHLASRELVAVAGAVGGAVLAIDDVHLIDRATLDLLEQLARTVARVPVALVVTHRPGFVISADAVTVPVETSERHLPSQTSEAIPASIRQPLARVAVIGDTFDHIEFEAASGLDGEDATRAIELAIAAGAIDRSGSSYRFTDADVARRLVDDLPGPVRVAVDTAVASRLAATGASSERVAERLLAAGDVQSAAPYLLEAAVTAAWALGYRDVLAHTARSDEVIDPTLRFQLVELRADACAALGLPEAIGLYREAIRLAPPERVTWLRVRLGRAFLFAGDVEGAAEVLAGLEPSGGPEDGGIMLVGGMLAYFEGDLERAESLAEQARGLALAPGAPPQMLDVISLQGMIAHSRGEWFDRLRRELRFTADSNELATTVFDSHLCVSQYLLYGPTGRDDVVALAAELRSRADTIGSPRAAAFALTLSGEAHFLAGDVDAARTDLAESVRLHTEIGADTGRAHSLQRLAEVELAAGNRLESEQLCRKALPLARWSLLSHHLMQRTYGTLIAASPDPAAAVAVVDEARETLDSPTSCPLCQVMVAVPSAIALAAVGRLDEAEVELEVAETFAARWDGPAWPAAVAEARAVVAAARGEGDAARRLMREAAAGFEAAHQPLDAARCLEALAPG